MAVAAAGQICRIRTVGRVIRRADHARLLILRVVIRAYFCRITGIARHAIRSRDIIRSTRFFKILLIVHRGCGNHGCNRCRVVTVGIGDRLNIAEIGCRRVLQIIIPCCSVIVFRLAVCPIGILCQHAHAAVLRRRKCFNGEALLRVFVLIVCHDVDHDGQTIVNDDCLTLHIHRSGHIIADQAVGLERSAL